MSCLAYSPPCHSAEVHSLSWDTVWGEGSSTQAGIPSRWKPQSPLNRTSAPFSSLTSTSKSTSSNAPCCVLWLLRISSPALLLFLSFHNTSYQLEEHGHRWVVLALEDLACADSTAAEQNFCDFTEQISRMLHTGLSNIHFIPLFTYRPSLYQTVPNIALKICRFSTAPALSWIEIFKN